jgi:hypothetical protein
LYNAAFFTKADIKVLSNRLLSLTATYVGTIEQVGLPVQNRNCPHIWGIVSEWYTSFFTNDSHKLDSTLIGELWRILTSDVIEQLGGKWSRTTRIDEPGAIMPDGMDGIAAWLPNTPFPEARYRSLITVTYGRTLCRTKQGHIGLCFPESRPSDEIWVLYGGRVLFLLRPIEEDLEEDASVMTDSYVLVGEAYLHGFMDGEAVRGREKSGRGIFLK